MLIKDMTLLYSFGTLMYNIQMKEAFVHFTEKILLNFHDFKPNIYNELPLKY